MFSEAHTKGSPCLPYIFHITVLAVKMVDDRIFEVFVIFEVVLVPEKFSSGTNTPLVTFTVTVQKKQVFTPGDSRRRPIQSMNKTPTGHTCRGTYIECMVNVDTRYSDTYVIFMAKIPPPKGIYYTKSTHFLVQTL